MAAAALGGGGRSRARAPGAGKARPGKGAPSRPSTCRYCGKPLPKVRSPKLRLCSDECRKRTASEQRMHPQVRVQFEDATEAERARRRAGAQPRHCKRCNKRIPAKSMRKRYCGDECAQRAAYESYRSNPAAVEENRARQREYARRRYATPEGRASYLAASKRYQERIKSGGEGPPLRRPGPRFVWVPSEE